MRPPSLAQVVADRREAEMRARPEARDRDLGKWEPRELRVKRGGTGRKSSLTPEQEARAVRLYLSGKTVLEVAQEIRTTADTIKGVMRRHGVQRKGRAGCGRKQRAARAQEEG